MTGELPSADHEFGNTVEFRAVPQQDDITEIDPRSHRRESMETAELFQVDTTKFNVRDYPILFGPESTKVSLPLPMRARFLDELKYVDASWQLRNLLYRYKYHEDKDYFPEVDVMELNKEFFALDQAVNNHPYFFAKQYDGQEQIYSALFTGIDPGRDEGKVNLQHFALRLARRKGWRIIELLGSDDQVTALQERRGTLVSQRYMH